MMAIGPTEIPIDVHVTAQFKVHKNRITSSSITKARMKMLVRFSELMILKLHAGFWHFIRKFNSNSWMEVAAAEQLEADPCHWKQQFHC